MFQNPDTIHIEILALVFIVAFIVTMIGIYAYKKTHNIPTGECACCHTNGKKLVKEYHKCYSSKK